MKIWHYTKNIKNIYNKIKNIWKNIFLNKIKDEYINIYIEDLVKNNNEGIRLIEFFVIF